jgi:hypothetical protein
MIKLKERANSSGLDDAITSLANFVGIREREGWTRTHDIVVTKGRDPNGGYRYVATVWLAKEG